MPPATKRLVCLANSRKLSGRCVAGKEFMRGKPGAWIRPVSARPTEEVSEHERQYEDGSDPQVLDIVDVSLLRRVPKLYQSENWLLDQSYYWVRVSRASWPLLARLADEPEVLWTNRSSSREGKNDRVLESEAASLDNSLYLIAPEELTLAVLTPQKAFGNSKRRVQARFAWKGIEYAVWVTDPLVERALLLDARDREYKIDEAFLTISLGEPFKDYCYKLAAAVITPQRGEPGRY